MGGSSDSARRARYRMRLRADRSLVWLVPRAGQRQRVAQPLAVSALTAARRSARSCANAIRRWCLSSRQADKTRVDGSAENGAGPASQRAVIAIKAAMENVEIKYSERIRQMPVNSTVPVTFSDDTSESAIKMPTTPPAENAPFHGRQNGRMESAVEMLKKQHRRRRTPLPRPPGWALSGSISRPAARASRAG